MKQTKKKKFSFRMRPSVFLSYKQESKPIVDEIEKAFTGQVKVCRDTNDLLHKESVSEFMDTIRTCDFAVFVLSQKYLESLCCMYEVLQFMQETDWKERAQFIVTGDVKNSIYNKEKHGTFIKFWKDKCAKWENDTRKLHLSSASEQAEQLKLAREIELNIGTFLAVVADSLDKASPGKNYSELLNYIFQTERGKKFKRRRNLLHKLSPVLGGFLCVCAVALIAYNASPHAVTIKDYALYETDLCTFRYEGQARWWRPSGEGTLTILWNNGEESSYTGTFADGYPAGSGTYVWYNGDFHESDDWSWYTETESLDYTGMFCDGKVYGFGATSEDLVVGEWHDGRLYGNGTVKVSDAVPVTGHYVWQDYQEIDENGIWAYEGYLVDGAFGGTGTIFYSDSDFYSYHGFLKEGKPYYYGEYKWVLHNASGRAQECKYSGLLDINGYPSGCGTFTYSDGTEVISENWGYDTQKDDVWVVDGYACSSFGDEYVGMTNDGVPAGYGSSWKMLSIMDDEPLYYHGEHKDGQPNGIGVMEYRENCIYYGEIADGYPCGEGMYRYADQTELTGTWFVDEYGYTYCNDVLSGYSVGWYDLASFVGEYRDGVPCGYGTYYFRVDLGDDSAVYHVESDAWSYQSFSYENSNSYEGMTCNGMANGYGMFTTADYTYEGSFREGKRHGLGTVTNVDNSALTAIWKDGIFVKEFDS